MSFNQAALNSFIRGCYASVAYWHHDSEPSSATVRYAAAQAAASKPLLVWLGLTRLHTAWLKAFASGDIDKVDAATWAIVSGVYEQRRKIEQEPTVKVTALTFLKRLLAFNRTESQSSLNYLTSKVTLLGAPELTRAIFGAQSPKEATGQPQLSEIKAIVMKLGGSKVDGFLSPNEMKAVRDEGNSTKEAMLKRYMELNRNARTSYIEALQNIVASSGDTYIPVKDAIKQLKAQGIVRTGIPGGFEGNIGADGSLYTTGGDKLAMNPSCPTVTMNPKYTGRDMKAYCFGAWPDAVRAATGKIAMTSYQTERQTKLRVDNKDTKVNKAMAKIDKMKVKWSKMMQSRSDEQRTLGAVLHFMYTCSLRVGTADTYSRGGATYGATTIEVRHCKPTGSKIRIKYPSKSDGLMDIEVLNKGTQFDRLMFDIMLEKLQGKEPDDKVWTYGGDGSLIGMKEINRWLKVFDPTFSSHMFRSLRASKAMTELLDEMDLQPPKASGNDRVYAREFANFTKGAVNYYLECATKVGDMLGHFNKNGATGTTAIGSYIMPSITKSFFHDNGIPIPSKIANLIKEKKSLE